MNFYPAGSQYYARGVCGAAKRGILAILVSCMSFC